ncbi:MAG: DNA-dependent RNA polymerase, partial [Chloroflexi bacterium]|nr:DNA-dependent RNA polymerase [Chloroflexota bacterium]
DQPLKLQITKQVNSITPNLVHSLDASHLMRTVNRLYSEGLRDFAMVHDSYGVHACDVDNLRSVLAKEFYAIHKHSISDQFIAELREANPEIKLPDPLPKGELDLEDVLQANYLFS